MITVIESVINNVTALTSNTDSVIFPIDSIRTKSSTCCGWLNHNQGSANYTILECGIYDINLNLTVSSATAGVVAFQVFVNGEPDSGTLMAETITAADDFANIGVNTRIKICCKGTSIVSIRSIPAVPTPTAPETPIATQVPIIISGKFNLARVA